MAQEEGPTELRSRFPDGRRAARAVDSLVAAGIPREAITITETSGGHEGRYLWRLVVMIVLWSIPGGAAGAAAGLGLALAGIGPGGTAGIVVQVVSWLIVGHLLAGMWAGYILLADRSSREMAPDREAGVLVTVRCSNPAQREAAARVLGAAKP